MVSEIQVDMSDVAVAQEAVQKLNGSYRLILLLEFV